MKLFCYRFWNDNKDVKRYRYIPGTIVNGQMSVDDLQDLSNEHILHDSFSTIVKHHGIDNLINLFGMESPGLTSSLVIADYVSELVN